MAELKSIYILWYREVLRLRRDRARLIASLSLPLLYLVVFGIGLVRPMGQLTGGVNFVQFLFPGILGMAALTTALMSGMAIVWERETGFLKEIAVAPVSRWSVVLGKILGGTTIALVQGLLLFILSPLFELSISLQKLLLLILYLFLMAFTLGAVGILVGSRTYTWERFQVMMQTILWPLIFLSGIFFPVNNLPGWLNMVVKINPVTYGVDAIRRLILPHFPGISLWGKPLNIAHEGLIIIAVGAVISLLAIYSFSRQEWH